MTGMLRAALAVQQDSRSSLSLSPRISSTGAGDYLRLGAVQRLAYEAADCGLLSADLAVGIRHVKGVKKLGVRLGNWLTAEQGQVPWQVPDRLRLKGKRERALSAPMFACGSCMGICSSPDEGLRLLLRSTEHSEKRLSLLFPER